MTASAKKERTRRPWRRRNARVRRGRRADTLAALGRLGGEGSARRWRSCGTDRPPGDRADPPRSGRDAGGHLGPPRAGPARAPPMAPGKRCRRARRPRRRGPGGANAPGWPRRSTMARRRRCRTRSSRSSTSSASWTREPLARSELRLPARAAPPRARRRPHLHQPAAAARARRARPRRGDPTDRRQHADARRDRDRDRPAAPGRRSADAQQTVVLRLVQEALQNIRKHASATRARCRHASRTMTWRARNPRRWARIRRRRRRRPGPAEFRPPVHARARRAHRRPLRSHVPSRRWHRRPAGDPASKEESR